MCPVAAILSDFFDSSAKAEQWPRMPAQIGAQFLSKARHYNLDAHVLIALVPDPTDSSFDFIFDRSIDAIRNAAETDGYVTDQFYLPWKTVAEQAQERRPDAGMTQTKSPGLAHIQPGAILFRRITTTRPNARTRPNTLLLVLLVGETPTKGVHKKALRNTIEFSKPVTESGPIRIIGPTYSGSVTSLRSVLADLETTENYSFDLVSGTATNPNNESLLTTPLADSQAKAGIPVKYRSTSAGDDDTRKALRHYLDNTLQVKDNQLAVLTEANTSYGAWFREPTGPDAGVSEPDAGSRNGGAEVYAFPLHVSQVRNALEQERLKTTELSTQFPRQFLQLSLEDDREASDTINPTARLTTPSVDLQLGSMFTTICRRNIKYLWLIATSVKDLITLADEGRKHCPSLRFVSLINDIFLTHEDFTALHGMIIATSYPLFRLAPWYVSHAKNTPIFAFQGAQGLYNATLIHLREMEADLFKMDAGLNYASRNRREFYPSTTSSQPSKPMIWIMVVGNKCVWPLSVSYSGGGVDTGATSGGVPDAGQLASSSDPAARVVPVPLETPAVVETSDAELPVGSVVLFLMLFAFVMVNVVALWIANADKQPAVARNPLQLFRLDQSESEKQRVSKQLIVTLCFWTLLLLYILELPPESYLRDPALCAVAVAGSLSLTIALMWIQCRQGARASKRWVWMLATFVVCVLFAVLYLRLQPDPSKFSKNEDVFNQIRRADITSGLSLGISYLWFGLFFYSLWLFHLRRVTLAAAFEPVIEKLKPELGEKWFEPFNAATQSMEKFAFVRLRSIMCLVALAILPVFFMVDTFLQPFEGHILGLLLHAVFVIAYVTIFLSGARYLVCWHAFRECLRDRAMDTYLQPGKIEPKDDPLRIYFNAIGTSFETTVAKVEERLAEVACRMLHRGCTSGNGPRRLFEVAVVNAYMSTQMSANLSFLTVGSLLLLLTSSTYPFAFEHSVTILTWLVVIGVAAIAIVVLVQMNRDPVRSRINGTTPGRITFDRDFVSSTIVHGLVPILALAAARFPSMGGIITSALDPIVRVFQR
jgi:hypothetical protein